MKTKLEIINETVEYYKTHNRGLRDFGNANAACVYLTPEGDKCAVGRCLKSPQEFWVGDVYEIFSDSDTINEYLLPEYTGHHIAFWKDLQSFHDNNNYWNGGNLTASGVGQLQKLKESYQ